MKRDAHNGELKSMLHMCVGMDISPTGKRIYAELTLLLVCFLYKCLPEMSHI